jgi:hypothetical protein
LWNYNREFDGKWVMDLHSEAAKRLQPCAELRALASAVGGRLFRLNGEQLIGGSLELVWLDTERPALPREEVDFGALWDILHDDVVLVVPHV